MTARENSIDRALAAKDRRIAALEAERDRLRAALAEIRDFSTNDAPFRETYMLRGIAAAALEELDKR